tara:strand:- start:514 stop:891 length:378 start_codon:yes stop_codon:yes gene_type:complete
MINELNINYMLWGLISTIVNLIIFKFFISLDLILFYTLLIYYLIGTLIKFLGYKYFVFKMGLTKHFMYQLIKYVFFVFFIMYLNYYFLEIAFEVTNIQYFYLQVIWVGITAPLSYFISKLFIFNN